MLLFRSVKSAAGFSLVEIVVALAVVTFCLLPIIGLFGVASQQGQSAEQMTDLALVLQSQETILGNENFDSLKLQVAGGAGAPSPIYYYASGGRYLGQTLNATTTPLAFYKCTVTQTPQQITAATTLAASQAAANQSPSSDSRIFVTLIIDSPPPFPADYAQPIPAFPIPGQNKKQRTFPLSFFRYGPRQ